MMGRAGIVICKSEIVCEIVSGDVLYHGRYKKTAVIIEKFWEAELNIWSR